MVVAEGEVDRGDVRGGRLQAGDRQPSNPSATPNRTQIEIGADSLSQISSIN